MTNGVFCPVCGGEFDYGEWNASRECPECETPIIRRKAEHRAALESASSTISDEAAIIERCAQIADDDVPQDSDPVIAAGEAIAGVRIAAAIRATSPQDDISEDHSA